MHDMLSTPKQQKMPNSAHQTPSSSSTRNLSPSKMNKPKEVKKSKKKNVQVACRIRPLNDAERAEKGKSVAGCDRVTKMISMQNPKEQKHFGPFDSVYGQEASQTDIYMDIVSPLIQEVLSGYNCTVFAYGQTGTGKTYTMEGRHDESSDYSWEEDPKAGIIPRALSHIFSELNVMALDDYCVRVSYVELYNEELFDLLGAGNVDEQARLRIFDDKAHNGNGVLIQGLTETAVRSRDEVYTLLKRGAERRRTATTLMNMNSSRSHSVFTVSVLFRDNSTSKSEELLLKTGKLHLVDLAGSESIGRSGAVDMRAREAGNINQSLLTLGRVINALTTNAAHIPYRESKLTRILQDSLGGKTITSIIACLSPSSTNFEESVSTLDYAQRAKNIKNNPEVNQQVTRKALLKEYNEEIEKLRKDLVAAREKNGIFLAQENYDQMQEQLTENNARVEELEGQLMALTSKLQLIMADMEFVEGQYELAYRNHMLAVEKLERRRAELKQEKQEHERAQKELQATKHALEQSTNKSTQLFAQAVQVNESNIVIGSELEAMHKKFEECKSIFEKNDKLFGQFSARRIHESHDIRDKVSAFAQSSSSSFGSLSRMCHNVEESVSQRLNTVADDVNKMFAHSSKFTDDTNEYLQSYTTYAKESGVKHLSSAEAKLETSHNNCLELIKLAKMQSTLIQKFSTFLSGNESKLMAVMNSYQNDLKSNDEHDTEAYDQILVLVNQLKKSNGTRKQKLATFVDGSTKCMEESNASWNETAAKFTKHYEEIVEVATEEQKNLDSIIKQEAKFVEEQLEMSEGVKNSLAQSVKELSEVVSEKSGNVNTNIESTVELCGKKIQKILNQHESINNSCATVTSEMDAHLATSQKDMEHFIHQEVLRYSSSGDTPARKSRKFGVELTQIPSADELIQQFSATQTPGRKPRRSLLIPEKNSTVMSPSTLKERLAIHKEVENEEMAEN